MKAQIALVSLEERVFALVVVNDDVLDDPELRDRDHQFYEQRVFRDVPVVLVNEDYSDAPSFFGPPHLTDILEQIQMDQVEWSWLDLPFAPPSYN
jgi:hypothetical protein